MDWIWKRDDSLRFVSSVSSNLNEWNEVSWEVGSVNEIFGWWVRGRKRGRTANSWRTVRIQFPLPSIFHSPRGLAKRPIIQPWIGVHSVVGRWSPVAATFSKIVPILVPPRFLPRRTLSCPGEIIHHSTGYHFPYLGRIEFPTDPRSRKITILIRIYGGKEKKSAWRDGTPAIEGGEKKKILIIKRKIDEHREGNFRWNGVMRAFAEYERRIKVWKRGVETIYTGVGGGGGRNDFKECFCKNLWDILSIS